MTATIELPTELVVAEDVADHDLIWLDDQPHLVTHLRPWTGTVGDLVEPMIDVYVADRTRPIQCFAGQQVTVTRTTARAAIKTQEGDLMWRPLLSGSGRMVEVEHVAEWIGLGSMTIRLADGSHVFPGPHSTIVTLPATTLAAAA